MAPIGSVSNSSAYTHDSWSKRLSHPLQRQISQTCFKMMFLFPPSWAFQHPRSTLKIGDSHPPRTYSNV